MTNKQCLNENYWSDNKYERREKEIGERKKKLKKEKNGKNKCCGNTEYKAKLNWILISKN